MRWCLRLVVQSQVMYLLRALSQFAGTEFPDRQIIDVPLCSAEQYMAANMLVARFNSDPDAFRAALRDGPSAVTVYSVEVVNIPAVD